MAAFDSYVPMLTKYLEEHDPKRILEWGPGESTRLMARKHPDATIETIEHQKLFFLKALEDLRFYPNVHVHEYDLSMDYLAAPLTIPKFDFAFVDGRRRARCIVTATYAVRVGGHIMVHDSERSEYRRAMGMLVMLEENDGTALMLNDLTNGTRIKVEEWEEDWT